jgi:hypothetical protein
MNSGYLIYQAERTMTPAEQREVDIWHAQFAAAISRLWHSLTTPPRRRGRPSRRTCGSSAAPGMLL